MRRFPRPSLLQLLDVGQRLLAILRNRQLPLPDAARRALEDEAAHPHDRSVPIVAPPGSPHIPEGEL